ncbi:GxxExxY protein [Geomesophilobacter sediminis]|uniref:GxxExxY protein n=1 Tax=Geomesophilobacter sediminis TaxID=2798584 RepID=A0A8J7LZ54_9BACT|nr:GxxExxY protein [Geomesophilobacter sediminis]MBJ6726157.1 GxxExxY protein [Geomesophilobacter sediminis]
MGAACLVEPATVEKDNQGFVLNFLSGGSGYGQSVDVLLPIHEAQLLSYLKLSGKKLGLLLNFNVLHLKHGLKRLVNHL